MGTRLMTDEELWDEIAAATEGCRDGERKVAVAYVSASRWLRLGSDDVLVVNTSEPAMRQGATVKQALLDYMAAGVRVYGDSRLHAKVMVFGGVAVIGSSNLSARAARAQSIEAAVWSDVKSLVAQSTKFVDDLIEERTPLTAADVAALPDADPKLRHVQTEPIAVPERVWVYWTSDWELTPEEKKDVRTVEVARRNEVIHTHVDDPAEIGDWLVRIHRDGKDNAVYLAPIEVIDKRTFKTVGVLVTRPAAMYEDLDTSAKYARRRAHLFPTVRGLRSTDTELVLKGDDARSLMRWFQRPGAN